MTWSSLNAIAALPEIFLLSATLLILIIDLYLSRTPQLGYSLTLLALFICSYLSYPAFFSPPQYAFNHMFISDPIAALLKIGLYIMIGLTFIYGKKYAIAHGILHIELLSLSSFALLGMMVMVSSSHLLTLYIGIELLSLSLYVLIALQRDNIASTEAAMKYFILSALASGLLLYGVSMIYGATGDLNISAIAETVSIGQSNMLLMMLGLVFIVTGIGFKLGVVPFHMWVPDIYQGAPTIVTQLISGAPKLAAFAVMFRLFTQCFAAFVDDWQYMLLILSMLSLIIGNIAAIAQTNIKRMFAYSAIAHMGYVLLGFLAATPAGYAASLFYIMIYALAASAGFGLIMLIADKEIGIHSIYDLSGLSRSHPWFAWMMLCVLFSMAGIPVFVGFFAKLAILTTIVDLGLVGFAVFAVGCSLIGAFYYLRVIKIMFFDEIPQPVRIEASPTAKWILSLNALLLLALGMCPNAIMASIQQAVTFSLI